ncbi:hypothetical protein Tco_0735276 [Tanacetum coccineum]
MGTKVTSSSGSVLEEPEIQKLQMQAKIFKENSLNKLNALKSTTQLLDRQSIWYQQAFARLFGDSFRTFKFQLSQHMNNLETLLNAEVSFSSDREVIENFRDYTKMTAQTFKETIIQNMNSIEQCIIERASHEQELKMTLKKLSERQLQIQQCKVQEVQSSVTSSGDETSSGIVSDEEIDKQKLEAHYSYMAKIQEVSPEESSSTSQPLEQVQNHDENDVFANVRRHSEQPESINDTYVLEKDDSNVIPDSSNICTNDNQVDQNAAECVDERAALANLIANLTLDTEENKTVLKQLKKANASLTQELKECKTNLDESSRALGEATSSRDSSLIALQTKQTELEKYTALNDLTSDYKILQTKLNETLGLLALKDIDIKEGLKTKTYEISVVNQKHDELVKKSLLTRSQFEGQLKEKSKVISDLKVKEGKDIDTMIEMDKQIKFLNEILYKRNQSIQTIHMLAPKCATYHGRSTFANPKYLKKAQSDKSQLLEYMDVHDNDASESSQPSWGKMYVRRTVADFSHAPLNEYSPSPDDKKQWSLNLLKIGSLVYGEPIQKLTKKESNKKAFQVMLQNLGGNENSEGTTSLWKLLVKTILRCYLYLLGISVLLLRHGTSDSGPDMSFDTSASLEYVSGLGRASLAKVISYVSLSMIPEEIIPHQKSL